MLLAVDTHEGIFFTREIWLYIFVGLGLLYVLAAIYNRIKRPKKEIKRINAKVVSVNKIRVQTNQRNTGLDGVMQSNAAIPTAKFNVTFVDEKNNEMFIFGVSETESDRIHVGESGVLCHNGDEFISFGEDPKDAERKYFVRKRLMLAAVLGVVVFGGGVWAVKYFFFNEKTSEEILVEEIDENTLSVYMSAHITNYGNPDQVATTRYHLGEFNFILESWGESAHMYYDAIESYKETTGRDVKVTHFATTAEMMWIANKEWKEGKGPDVIIGDYTNSGSALYQYIQEGMFEDLMPYFEKDEIYSGGEYVSEVLAGGLIGDAQLVFPLTFNMNVLFTSEERMKKHALWLSDEMSYEDILDLFQNEWNAVREEDEYLMVQTTNTYKNQYPLLLFQSASGVNVIDFETGKIQLSEEVFTEWAKLYESYVCNEYNMNRDELKEFSRKNADISIPVEDSAFEILKNLIQYSSPYDLFGITEQYIFCYAEGGSFASCYHPFVANARYYESRLTENEEEFVCIGIPTRKSMEEYAAEITSYGIVLSGSSKTEAAYEFVKTLADHERWMHFDLSVNRQQIMNAMEELSNNYYKLNWAVATASPAEITEEEAQAVKADGNEKSSWYGDDGYEIQPLSEKTKNYLLEMVEHIGVATLPEYEPDRIVIEEIGEYIWGRTDTIEEAYEIAIERMVKMGYSE